ncbi:arylsulfatase I-like isoform X2 [Oscarella lobularis]|uniref:arylsulfatase I-like isoform X2 n=1 Tax=Oscarella lobularis TaxID=121494 RepID=UPI003313922B
MQRLVNSDQPPNIIFILADDYGYHDIGYHGSEIKTPNLDKLAESGVKLENYYVQPICTPTRSQLLSGRYQIHTGLQCGVIWAPQPNGIPLNDTLLPEKMKKVGYATHAIGKWHVGFYQPAYLPTRRGFDSFYGYLTGREDYLTHMTGTGYPYLQPKRGSWNGVDFHRNDQVVRNENGTYSTYLFSREAVNIINDPDSQNGPFFIYLAYQAVHGPLEAPDSYVTPYMNISDRNRRVYAGMVSAMDEGVGNITRALAKNGLSNSTLIVFSTDNGGQVHAGGNNWPLRGWKRSLWEGGIKGVGFVHGSMINQPKRISTKMIHVSDWYPTLVHVAGGNVTGLKLDGYNQWDTISNDSDSPRTEILHNIQPTCSNSYENFTYRAAVRIGDWKLIVGNPGNSSWVPPPGMKCPTTCAGNVTTGMWLFNIAEDPEERNDLSDAYLKKVKELLDRIEYYNSTAVPARYPDPDLMADPALHDGAWVPWQKDPESHFESVLNFGT